MERKEIYHLDLDKNELMYKPKTTLNDLILKGEECSLCLETSSLTGFKEKLEKIKKQIENSKIKAVSLFLRIDKDYIDDEKELETIKNIAQQCEENGLRCELILNDGNGVYKDFIVAKQKVDKFLDKLHNLTINENGKERKLTVAERYFVIYNYAANRVYNMNEIFMNNDMRNWLGVLSSDHVICSGFASLLKFLCDREFSKEELVCFTQGLRIYKKENHEEIGGHANNIVYIKDPYYGINNITYNDACWDSKKDKESAPTFRYFLLNPDDIFAYKYHEEDTEFDFESSLFYLNPETNKTIDFIDCISYKQDKVRKSDDFLSKILGEKAMSKLIEDYNVNEKVKEDEDNQELERQRKIEEFSLRYKQILNDNHLEMTEDLSVPAFYPNSTLATHPELKEFEDYFQEVDLDSLDPEMIKKYYDYVASHEELYQALHKKADDNNFKIFVTLDRLVVRNTIHKNFKYKDFRKIHKQKLAKLLEEHTAKIKDKYKKFNQPLHLPQRLLKNGLTAVAKMNGLTKQSEIEDFIESEIQERATFRKEQLGIIDNDEEYEDEVE